VQSDAWRNVEAGEIPWKIDQNTRHPVAWGRKKPSLGYLDILALDRAGSFQNLDRTCPADFWAALVLKSHGQCIPNSGAALALKILTSPCLPLRESWTHFA
jgi:hypothetical protein